jgi:hypothetical protein
MKKLGIALSALLVVGVGCPVVEGETKAKDGAEIRALEQRFAAAFKAKDVNTIMQAMSSTRACLFSTRFHDGNTSGPRLTERISRTSLLASRVRLKRLRSATSALSLTITWASRTVFNVRSLLIKTVRRRMSRSDSQMFIARSTGSS